MKTYFILVIALMFKYSDICGQINFVSGKQFGTKSDDIPAYLITDSLNNVYLFGTTSGLVGKQKYGKKDGVIYKINDTGKLEWARQLGSEFDDEFIQGKFDENNNIVVVGYYSKEENNKDVWVLKFKPNGVVLWEKTFGSDSLDVGWNIAVNKEGHIYIIGQTEGKLGENAFGESDCFILKLNTIGEKQKIVQFGSQKKEKGYGIGIGANSQVYVCGATFGNLAQNNLGKLDAFWGIFSKELKQQKIIQFGTGKYDQLHLIQVDSDENIVFGGITGGRIGAQHYGQMDAYLRKMDKNGVLLWEKQFGTKKVDYLNGITFTEKNDVLISGCQNWSDCQAFCRLYSESGELLWKNNYVAQGKEHGTCGKGICINSQGYIYHTGATGDSLFADVKGEHDVYLIKLKLELEE